MASFGGNEFQDPSNGNCQYATIELKALTQQWDRHVRHYLGELAERRWPDHRILGVIPAHSYRLHRQQSTETVTWWVEYDLPSRAARHNASYRITFCLDQDCHPSMILECQSGRYPIEPLTPKKFQEILRKLETQPQLTIPRPMGAFTDL